MPDGLSEIAPCVPSFSEGVKFINPETAAATKLKMDLERWKYEHNLNKINLRWKLAEEACSRNVEQAKDEYLKTVAYGKACQNHKFEKYDPFKGEPLDTSLRRSKKKKKKIINYRPDTFKTVQIPEMDDPDTLVNSLPQPLTLAALNKSFPQIASRESKDRETENKSVANSNFNALVLWKSAAHKLFNKEKQKKKERKKDELLTRKAKAKLTVERPVRKNIFPGECKSPAALKKFMEHETELVLQEMTAPKHKKDDKFRKMVDKAQLPNLIRRDRTFSAIVREFKSYKEEKQERKHKKMIDYITRHFHQNTAL